MDIELILLLVMNGIYLGIIYMVWYLMNDQLKEERKNVKIEEIEVKIVDPDTEKLREVFRKLVPLMLRGKKKEVDKIIAE